MTYTEELLQARVKVRDLVLQLDKAKKDVESLLRDCPHEWKDPPRGYEHEGKSCAICGISELSIKR